MVYSIIVSGWIIMKNPSNNQRNCDHIAVNTKFLAFFHLTSKKGSGADQRPADVEEACLALVELDENLLANFHLGAR